MVGGLSVTVVFVALIPAFFCATSTTPAQTTTAPYVPDAVGDLNFTYIASTSVGLTWRQPHDVQEMNGYVIYVIKDDVCLIAYFTLCDPDASIYIQGDPCNTMSFGGFLPCTEVVKYNVSQLLSYTEYDIAVAATNNFTVGVNVSVAVHTEIGIPSPPISVQGSPVNNSALEVEWIQPDHFAGPTFYRVRVLEALSRQWFNYYLKDEYIVEGYNETSVFVTGLLSSWKYRFLVASGTSAGNSTETASEPVFTLPSVPDVVERLQVKYVTDRYMALMVSWDCPDERKRNGEITGYTVRYEGNSSLTVEDGNYYPEDPCTDSHKVYLPVLPDDHYNITVIANAQFTGKSKTISSFTDIREMKYIVHSNHTQKPTESHSKAVAIVGATCGCIIAVLLAIIALLVFKR